MKTSDTVVFRRNNHTVSAFIERNLLFRKEYVIGEDLEKIKRQADWLYLKKGKEYNEQLR